MKTILTIARKEWQSALNNPTAYVVGVAFLLLWEFLFFRNVFLVGEASLQGLFDLLPWMLLLVVPALSMGLLAEEKHDGTIEFLLTHPVNPFQLVMGKFLGILAFLLALLLFILPLGWSIGRFGNLDWGQVVGQYCAGAFMAAMFVSLGIFVSGLFASQVSAFLVSAVAGFFFIIAGLDMVTSRLPLSFAPFFEQLSVSNHFNSMSRGVIDARDLWYFLSFSAIFLGAAAVSLLKNKYGNKRSAYRTAQTALVLLIGIGVLSNIVGARIPGRIDLTEDKVYTLSSTTEGIVSHLSDIVNVTIYASGKLPAQLQPVLRETKDVIEDYRTASNGMIRVSVKDPSADSGVASEAESAGVQAIRFNVVSQEAFQVQNGYLGIGISYAGKQEAIPFVENTNDLEYQLTSLINELTVSEKPKIGFLSGHGEKSVYGDYSALNLELQKQFDVTQVAAASDEDASKDTKTKTASSPANKKDEAALAPKHFTIPDGVKALVIPGPTEVFSDEEKKTLSDFVEKGGSILFLIDGVTASPDAMSASANASDVATYLKDMTGVEVKKNLVYDLRSNQPVSMRNGSMQYVLPYPLWVGSQSLSETSPIVAKLRSVTLPWSSEVVVDNDAVKAKGFEATPLLGTTASGGTQESDFDIQPDQKFSSGNISQKTLAVSLAPISDSKGRLVVVGDSGFLGDQFVQNNPGNLSFALQALSWLGQETALSKIGIKNLAERKLVFTSDADPSLLKFGNMGFVLLAISGFGAIRLTRRRRMKNEPYRSIE